MEPDATLAGEEQDNRSKPLRQQQKHVTVDDDTLLKIKKCLDRGSHPSTSESEAKAALHLASRLMAMHNVSQAQVFARQEASDHVKHGGQCDVLIDRTDGDPSKGVRKQGHLRDLGSAITTYFDCQYYTTGRKRTLTVSFYGVKANVAAAADAFEMVFNLVAEWALSYKGNGPRESYCLGISKELYRMAAREKKAEEAQVKQAEDEARHGQEVQETVQRQAALARLMPLGDTDSQPSPPYSDASPTDEPDYSDGMWSGIDSRDAEGADEGAGSDYTDEDHFEPTFKIEDDDDLDVLENVDESIQELIKQEPRPSDDETCIHAGSQMLGISKPESNLDGSKTNPPIHTGAIGWTSHSQLVLFRNTAEAVASEYLKTQGIKIHKSRKRDRNIRDREAYNEGKRDSHKIDVRGNIKRIKSEPT